MRRSPVTPRSIPRAPSSNPARIRCVSHGSLDSRASSLAESPRMKTNPFRSPPWGLRNTASNAWIVPACCRPPRYCMYSPKCSIAIRSRPGIGWFQPKKTTFVPMVIAPSADPNWFAPAGRAAAPWRYRIAAITVGYVCYLPGRGDTVVPPALRRAPQPTIALARRGSPLVDRPDDQALTAPGVAGGKHARHAGDVTAALGAHVAARVRLDA